MKWCIFLLLATSVLTFSLAGYKTFLSLTHPVKYQVEINEIATELSLNPSIIASVINVESSYNERSKSNKNAIGLMQIKLSTANYMAEIYDLESVTEQQLFNPEINIRFGSLYLKYLMQKFKNLDTVAASYNAGETRVRNWLKNKQFSKDNKTLLSIPYEETRNYVKKVKQNMQFYNKVYSV